MGVIINVTILGIIVVVIIAGVYLFPATSGNQLLYDNYSYRNAERVYNFANR